MTWDEKFLGLAHHVAEWSKDTTKVGAVITNENNRVVALGYNGFPSGVIDDQDRYNNREIKYIFTCHAERNALDNATCSLDGCTIYSTLEPCVECTKAIIQNRIKRIVTHKPTREDTFNWKYARVMLQEAGVELEYLDSEKS